MKERRIPMITSAIVANEDMPDLEEPIIVSAEETSIALRIRDGLLSDSRLGGADLEIRIHDEHATISGSVHTEQQRDIALSIAGRYVGRDRVIDHIETGEQISYFCEA